MELSLPAMACTQGRKINYITTLSFEQLKTLVSLCDIEEKAIEQRYQRPINHKRVISIGNYIVKNIDADYTPILPPLMFGITSDSICYKGNGAGTLKINLNDCKILIHDGQHRFKGILKALKSAKVTNHEKYLTLCKEQVGIYFVVDPDLNRSRQIFADINGNSKPSNPSTNILFEQRQEISQITREIWQSMPLFYKFIEVERGALPVSKIWQYSTFYRVNKAILQPYKKLNTAQKKEMLVTFWNAVAENMPVWNSLLAIDDSKELEKTIETYKKTNIALTGLLMYSLGIIAVNLAKTKYPKDWNSLPNLFTPLQAIDWTRNNNDYAGFCIYGNKIVSNKRSREALANYILKYLAS